MVKTPHFYLREDMFDPWWGITIPQVPQGSQNNPQPTKQNKKTKTPNSTGKSALNEHAMGMRKGNMGAYYGLRVSQEVQW